MESSEGALVNNLAIEFLIHLYGDCTCYVLSLSKNLGIFTKQFIYRFYKF